MPRKRRTGVAEMKQPVPAGYAASVKAPSRQARTAALNRRYQPYQAQPLWPGIYDGFDALCSCPWAYGPDGEYQVKLVNRNCLNHIGRLPHMAADDDEGP